MTKHELLAGLGLKPEHYDAALACEDVLVDERLAFPKHIRKAVDDEPRHQLVPLGPGGHRPLAIRRDVRVKAPDEPRLGEDLLNVVPAPKVQRQQVRIRRRQLPLDGIALPFHRDDVRLQLRPARETKLAGDGELGLGELRRGGERCGRDVGPPAGVGDAGENLWPDGKGSGHRMRPRRLV